MPGPKRGRGILSYGFQFKCTILYGEQAQQHRNCQDKAHHQAHSEQTKPLSVTHAGTAGNNEA